MPFLTSNFEQERLEVAAILSSGALNRAPSLAQLLTYVCDKYFEGQASQIKEYNIAVEALRRPESFDQKKDSIVRVEAHRLRKRLKEYYEGPGAGHSLRLEIPSGQYVPHFVPVETLAITPPVAATEPEPHRVPAASELAASEMVPLETVQRQPREFWTLTARSSRRNALTFGFVGVFLFAFVGLAAFGYFFHPPAEPTASAASIPLTGAVPVASGETIRIRAGAAQPYTDRYGQTWLPDRYFHGGSVFSTPTHAIANTRDPAIYQTRREGVFGYDIPLLAGSHELRLHFAEVIYGEANLAGGGETSRLFNIRINGKRVVENMDVVADAGPSSATVRVFKDINPAADGYLHLDFDPAINLAFINAIELSPGIPGKLRPIRILALDHGYTDISGESWDSDRYFQGGQHVARPISVSGARDPEIYRGERFGNLVYSIPVAKGKYSLVLHFAETWFGPNKPTGGGVGSRVFDILCNGVALVRDFDIYKEAGGCDRAVERVYHGLEATPQGKLIISMIPKINYACINALEVLDESGSH